MYDRILVAIDDSEHADDVLAHAIGLAEPLGAHVTALTVVETTGSPMSFGVEQVDELNRAAESLLAEARAAHDDSDVDLTVDVVRGQPAPSILEYAEEDGADAIMVGQRGVSGLSGAIIGSTADRLARLSTIPVTIVPGTASNPA